jgi:hypothetical protein
MRTSWRWSLVVALLVGIVAQGALGAASVQADAGPLAPVVIVPLAPVELGLPTMLPAVVVGTIDRSRDSVSWSTRGRADVDVDIERQQGRALVP